MSSNKKARRLVPGGRPFVSICLGKSEDVPSQAGMVVMMKMPGEGSVCHEIKV
jgi:hypothetical protein